MSKCFQLTRLIFCVFKYWPDFRQRSKQMYIPDVTLLRTGAFKRINSQCQHKKVHYLPKPTQYPYKYVFIYLLSSINYCLHYFPTQTDHPYSIVNQVNQKSAVLPASVDVSISQFTLSTVMYVPQFYFKTSAQHHIPSDLDKIYQTQNCCLHSF